MQQLSITRQDGRTYTTTVDDADGHLLTRYQWHVVVKSGRPYLMRRDNTGKHIYLHQQLVGIIKRFLVIDHINGDSLYNRRSNLRVVPTR